jgi:hypothetical protein
MNLFEYIILQFTDHSHWSEILIKLINEKKTQVKPLFRLAGFVSAN